MPQLETIEPLSERSWIKVALLYGMLAAPAIAASIYLYQIRVSDLPVLWLLPAALAALVWLILTYEAYTHRCPNS